MDKILLFDLAARHAEWASVRQATIAANIANANTPGYRASDVEPFTSVLDRTRLTQMRTDPRHMVAGSGSGGGVKLGADESWSVTATGNSVSLDQQMVQAGEAHRAFSLDTSIARAFHRMMLASVRSG